METTEGNIEYLTDKLRGDRTLGEVFEYMNDLEMLKELKGQLEQVGYLIEMLRVYPILKDSFKDMNDLEILKKLNGQLEQVGYLIEMLRSYDSILIEQFKDIVKVGEIEMLTKLKLKLHLVERLITTLGNPYQGMSDKMLQELNGQLQQGIEEIQAANLEAREAVEAKEARIANEIGQRERRNERLKKSRGRRCDMFSCSARGGYKQRNKTQRRMKKRQTRKRRMTKRRLTKRRMTKRQTKRRTSRK